MGPSDSDEQKRERELGDDLEREGEIREPDSPLEGGLPGDPKVPWEDDD